MKYIRRVLADINVFNNTGRGIEFLAVVLLLIVIWISRPEIMYSYPTYEIVDDVILSKCDNSVCFYINRDGWTIIDEVISFTRFKAVYPIKADDILRLQEALQEIGEYDDVYVFVSVEYDMEETVSSAANILGFENYELVYDTNSYGEDAFERLYHMSNKI